MPTLRTAMVLVAVCVFGVTMVALGARATYGARVTADEPQYLLTALSLAEDFDLDISDEIAAERYRPYHELRLNPQTMELNDTGQQLSPHDPLLPLLLALPTRAWGWAGAKTALAAIGAATAATTLWLAVRRFGVSVGVGALVVGGLFMAPPLVSYGNQVYPEMPAALCVAGCLCAVTGNLTNRSQAVAVLCIVALPWLAVKYAPVALVLALALLVRMWHHDRPRARLLAVLLGVAGLGYLVAHRRIYGGWTVYATGDHFVDGELSVIGNNPDYVGRTRRLAGLLVDRGFGLIPWTPAYLFMLPALVGVARLRIRDWHLLVAVLAVGWATATWVALTMHGWWWPGRQLVVVLPAAVVAMAVLADRVRVLLAPILVGCALGAAGWAWLAIEASTGRRTLVVDFEETSNPWYQAWSFLFPDHRNFDPAMGAWTWLWLAIIAVGCASVWRTLSPSPRREEVAA